MNCDYALPVLNREELPVLQKCANPICDTQFKYLHQGKLFEVETQYRDSSAGETGRAPRNGKGQAELYRLCERCAAQVVLRFDRSQGLVMEQSFPESNGEALAVFPQPSGTNALEISRILIRRLDLNSIPRNANQRTREAA
jgi:hypothetical protein